VFGTGDDQDHRPQVDTSYEIYLSLYQAVTGTEEEKNIYKQFSPDFFDLIVVDECHRGSAAEDSAWRDILSYFGSATQIGLTATPKETKTSPTPLLRRAGLHLQPAPGHRRRLPGPLQGHPHRLDKDTFGWRPTAGMTDKHGQPDRRPHLQPARHEPQLVLEQRTPWWPPRSPPT
jgi:type I restriction enzyme R subunit